ncbi:MAG: hypothetical protein IPM16_16085 [Chloroflexi bacterium]|nr:hypothetical protein [Chloroflexota bacterium]
MLNAPARSVLDVVTDFLAANPSADELLAYHLPEDLQARVDDLVERNAEGELTPAEQQELFDFVRVDDLIALLKAKVKLRQRDGDA